MTDTVTADMMVEATIDDVLYNMLSLGDGEVFYEDVSRVLAVLGLDPVAFYEKISQTLEEISYHTQAVKAYDDDPRHAAWKFDGSHRSGPDFVDRQSEYHQERVDDGRKLLSGLGRHFG